MATGSEPTPTISAGPDNSTTMPPSTTPVSQGSNSITPGRPGQPAATASPQVLPAARPLSTGAIPTDGAQYAQASFQPTFNQPDLNSGMLKDGRVRNPVPSKLKGKTDNKKGNFAVMHMDLKGKDLAPERDAAAKRTSESTEMAAKLAYKNGYVAVRRSRFVHLPDESGSQHFNGSPAGAPGFPPAAAYRQQLGPAETKEEQARLLTLLRSISPNLVVDQICKALAFFGGIPGAPPPADGRFPESERSNGPGALFVGWIAEIFPNLGDGAISGGAPGAAPYSAPHQPYHGEKRPRGRPKGSKASKFRSDKGIKKGPKRHLVDLTGEPAQEDGVDDSWVDVDDAEDRAGAALRSSNPFYAPGVTASSRKRGRPKGSKNRPKDGEERTSAPIATPIPESGLFNIGRKKAGRPKGSKNKPRESAAQATSEDVVEADDAALTDEPVAPAPAIQATGQPGSAAIGGAAFEASARTLTQEAQSTNNVSQPASFQPVNVGGPSAQPPPVTNPPSTDSGQTSKKRKRKGKDAEAAQNTPTPAGSRNNANSTKSHNLVSQTPIPVPVVPVISAPPPPKRQRKSKETKPTPAKSKASTPNNSTTAAAISSRVADQQPEPQVYTSPTIEELEAQLEEHANSNPPPAPVPAAVPTPVPAPRPQLAQRQQNQATQPRNDQRQAMLSRQQRQRQQQTASPSLNQVNTASPHLSSVQSASPSLSQVQSVSPSMSQQQGSKSQTPTSVTPQPQQQQTRSSQPFFSQSRPTQSQYGQQSPQQQQQQQQVTQTQQYSSQPQKSQFVQQQQQTYSPQQQPQYAAQQNKQQSYNSQQTSQRYPSQQQQQYSTYTTTSSNSAPQTLSQQSPQFGATNSSSFSSGDGSFRSGTSTGMSFNNSSFNALRTTTASPSDNTYRGAANSYGNSARQSSSFGGRTPLPSSTSSHTSVQGVQSLPNNLQGFQNFTDLSSFDMSNLDASGHSGLGLNTASYNMGTGNVSRGGSNTGSSYATSAMTNFDTNLGSNDRYYVGRR